MRVVVDSKPNSTPVLLFLVIILSDAACSRISFWSFCFLFFFLFLFFFDRIFSLDEIDH